MPERPITPPPRKPVSELLTANHADGYFTELVNRDDSARLALAPLKRGTKYSDVVGSDARVISEFAARGGLYFLKEIKPGNSSDFGNSDKWIIWLWATIFAAESPANSTIDYPQEDALFPRFNRRYTVRRDTYEATPSVAYLSPLTALLGVQITAGGAGYSSAALATVGGAGTGAAVSIVISAGVVISAIVTAEGTGHTASTTITFTDTGGGAGATATAIVQPATCVLTHQQKDELPIDSPLAHEFVGVSRLYETLPGPWIYSTRLDDDGETVTAATRRNKTADIASAESLYAGVWTKVSKQGGDVNVAQEVSESRYVPARETISAIAVSTGGEGYGTGVIITLEDDNGELAVPAKLAVGYVRLQDITIEAGGTGYSVGDAFVFSATGPVKARAEVTSVSDSGAITGLNITVNGSFIGVAGGALSEDGASSVSGGGATLRGIYGVSTVHVVSGGRYAAAASGLDQASAEPAGGTGATFASTTAPTPIETTTRDEDGVSLKSSRSIITKAAWDEISNADRETVSGGIWTRLTFADPAQPGDKVGWQTTTTRTIPGEWRPFTDFSPLLGPVQGRKRLIEDTGSLTPSQTLTTKTTYDAVQGSGKVVRQIEETTSDGSGSAGNPLFPVLVDDTDDEANGPTQKVTQLVPRTGLEVGSRVVLANGITLATLSAAGTGYTSAPAATISGAGTGAAAVTRINAAGAVIAVIVTNPGSGYTGTPTIAFSGGGGTGAAAALTVGSILFRKIEFNDYEQNPDLLKKEVTTFALPGPVRTSGRLDEDGAPVAITQQVKKAADVTPAETLSGGTWTKTTKEEDDAVLAVEKIETRAIPGAWRPFTDFSPLLGPVQGRKRLIEDTGSLTASQTLTTKTTYDAVQGSSKVVRQIEETTSDGTGSAGNPLFPVLVDDTDHEADGPTQKVTQLVPRTGLETGSRAVLANGIILANITNDGTAPYTSAPAAAVSGAGTGATAVTRINSAGDVVAVIITNPGSGYTGTPTISFSGGGGAGAAASLTVGASLFRKIEFNDYEPNPDLLKKEVTTFALPGPVRTSGRLDEDGVAVAVTRQVKATGSVTPAETLVGTTWTRITKEEDDAVLALEKIETRTIPGTAMISTRVDEDGKTVTIARTMESAATVAAITPRETLVGTLWTKISSKEISALVAWKIVETRAIPGTAIPDEPEIDHDGVTIAVAKTMESIAAITEGESLTGGIWRATTSQAITELVAWKITRTRGVSTGTSPIIGSQKWNEEMRVEMYDYWQFVPDGTAPPLVGSTYGTGSILVHNAIASLTIADPGSNYIAVPTLTIAAPDGGGGTQATGTVDSLKVVGLTIAASGSLYALGYTITFAGGTFTTACIATVTLATLSGLDLGVAGTSYVIGEIITLAGGVADQPATVTVNTLQLSSVTPDSPGALMVPGGPGVGTDLTLTGGTFTAAATLRVTHTKVVSATVANAGASGTGGTQTVTGTTGTGTLFEAIVEIDGTGGTIVSVTSISVAGDYTVNPADISAEPVTGAGLVGAALSLGMGVQEAVIVSGGSYTVTPSSFGSTGGNNSATFVSPTFGLSTFTLSGGSYTEGATDFFQLSTTGTGSGATFNTPSWTVTGLTITTPGAYTAVPTAAATQSATSGAGSGLTAVLNFGVGAVTMTNAGTLYYTEFPEVTISTGNAHVIANPDTLIVKTGVTGFVRTHGLLDTEHALIKRMIWTTCATPPGRKSNPSVSYQFPALFQAVEKRFTGRPSPGYNYVLRPHVQARFPARETILYAENQTTLPAVFAMQTYASASNFFPIPTNCWHTAFDWMHTIDGTLAGVDYAEKFPASTPYRIGMVLVIEASQKNILGNLWERRIIQAKESGPIY